MKLFVVCALLLLVGIESGKLRENVCYSTGDPHVHPFKSVRSGNNKPFTNMQKGSFTFAKLEDENFEMQVCTADISEKGMKKATTWNKAVAVKDGENTIIVDVDGTLKVTIGTDLVFDDKINWKSKAERAFPSSQQLEATTRFSIKHQKCCRHRKCKKQGGTLRDASGCEGKLVIHFLDSGRVVHLVRYQRSKGKWGQRKFINMYLEVKGCKTKLQSFKEKVVGWCSGVSVDGTRLTNMKKIGSTASFINNHGILADDMFQKACAQVDYSIGTNAPTEAPITPVEEHDCYNDAVKAIITQRCNSATTSSLSQDEVEACVQDACGNVEIDENNQIIDETIDEIIEEEEDTEIEADVYTCPRNSYINTKSWPLAGFSDCKCYFGYKPSEDAPFSDETECVKITTEVVATPDTTCQARCFCGAQNLRCSHKNEADRSCVAPLHSNPDKSLWTDGDLLSRTTSQCSAGTDDCADIEYNLQVTTSPAGAEPNKPFAIQPAVSIFDQNGALVTCDSLTELQIRISNTQSTKCACRGDTPCKHNTPGDNSCFAKQSVFGVMNCPAGTTECLPAQTNVKMYRDDPNDPSVKEKDAKCRNGDAWGKQHTETSNDNFCSNEVPCKHINDGTCHRKTTYNIDRSIDSSKAPAKCHSTKSWRTATPSPMTGWHFVTDASCDMQNSDKGCSVEGHSYAMDKWCDVNCHPKVKGQAAFCPASHCTCPTEDPVKENAEGWACPFENYNDGTCLCTPGTEECGSISKQVVKGTAQFEHLTIASAGTYELEICAKMPNPETNLMRLCTTTMVVVQKALTKPGCMAKADWNKPGLPTSEVQGAGQGWHFEDGKNVAANGQTTFVSAMTKWCRANACAEHTLKDHCAIVETATATDTNSCPADGFGFPCCSNNFDQCNVCDGDGSTCKYVEVKPVEIIVDNKADMEYLKDPSCVMADGTKTRADLSAPCKHVNDGTCVPKTNSSVNGEDYCYLDERAEDKSYFKYGTWTAELWKSAVTTETGLHVCMCPEGTRDLTPAVQALDALEKQEIEKVQEELTNKKIACDMGTITDAITKAQVEKEVKQMEDYMMTIWDTPGCTGRPYKIDTPKNDGHGLCGKHFAPGQGSCAHRSRSATCVNDRVHSIELGPYKAVNVYKHCQGPNDRGQKLYTTIKNTGATRMCVDIPSEYRNHVSRVEMVNDGRIVTKDITLVGDEVDVIEETHKGMIAECNANDNCKSEWESIKTTVKSTHSTFVQVVQQRQTAGTPITAQILGKIFEFRSEVSTRVLSILKSLSASNRRRLTVGAGGVTMYATVVGDGSSATASSSTGGFSSATANYATASTQQAPASSTVGSGAPTTTASGGTGAAAVAGTVVGCVAAIALVAGLVVLKKRQAKNKSEKASANKVITQPNPAVEDSTDVL